MARSKNKLLDVCKAQKEKLGLHNKIKFKTQEERQEVFRDLIKHLENGWDWESFEHCDRITAMKYITDFPEDFPSDQVESAVRRGHKVMEGLLAGIATGKIDGNAPTAIFLAKNKIGYRDRREVEIKRTDTVMIDDTPDNLLKAQEMYMKLIKGEVLENDDDNDSIAGG